jgi:hypothetical protein
MRQHWIDRTNDGWIHETVAEECTFTSDHARIAALDG